jgi:hypothetical protein
MSRPAAIPSLVSAFLLFAALVPGAARADWLATGRFLYRDRVQDLDGFTGVEPDRPARRVDVQVFDATTSAILASGATDLDGNFSIPVVDAQVRSVRARMVSLSGSTPGLLLDVRNNTAARQPYSVVGDVVAGHVPTANVDFGTVIALPGAGGEVFNVFDVLLDGFDFYASLQGGSWPPLRLTAFWQTGSADGTYFSRGDNSIHLRGGDAWDDTVIGHEQGHFVSSNWSNDDNPGGTHVIGDNFQDLRLAWSEGFATFFAGATRRALGRTPLPPAYIDTDGAPGPGGLNFSFELEGPSVEALGAGNEVTVGAALWDIVDDAATPDLAPGDDDGLARPAADPWDVIENVLPLPGVQNVSLEDFWDGWFRPGFSKGFQPQMEAAFDALEVRYRPDAFEADDTFAGAAPLPVTGAPQARTFWPVFDADHGRFDALPGQSFLVETTDLLSDGNTFLTVYAPDQSTIVGSNDDRGPGEAGSRVFFTAAAAGPHYAKVVHAADLGVYGTYALRVLRVNDPGATAFTEVGGPAGVANAGNSRGCAWGDVDADGDPDLFVANLGGVSALYRNQGGVFADRAVAWGANVSGEVEGAAWCDYDKDGDLDLFVTTIGSCRLLQNRRADSGDSVFVDVTAAAGMARTFEGRSAAWADADRDGFADLYVTDAGGTPALFRNQGNGTFTDVAAAVGVAFPGASISAAWCDYDRDGDDDLYVLGDDTPARLYRNALRPGGVLAFADVTATAGVPAGLAGFACEWGDFDGDGWQDLYVADGGGPNRLYRNRGDGGFDDVAPLRNAVVPQFSTTGTWGDVENDGDLDLFVGNLMQSGVSGTNQLLENVGGQFTASPHLAASLATRSAAWADYDRDGDLDLYLTLANGQPNQLLRNESTNPRRVEIALLGRTSNRDGYGATVRVRTGPRVQHRVVSGGSGFGSQPSAPLEFGLASATQADSVVVDWPSGKRSILVAVPQGVHLVDEQTAVDADDGPGDGAASAGAAFALALEAPRPQPARAGACRIAFTVPGAPGGTATVPVRLRMVDAAGRARRTLLDGALPPGPAALAFDGRDDRGAVLPAGLYLVEIAAGGSRAARKLVVLP